MATPNGTSTLPNGNGQPASKDGPIETTYLIVGAGPAGSALASFLASYNQTGIVISAAPGTAKEPRAHITNPAAIECLRDIGLQDEVYHNATPQSHMQHTRWCHSMAGEEYARMPIWSTYPHLNILGTIADVFSLKISHSWGNQPERRGEYEAASPCYHVDLPQTLMEPILVKNAINKGWKMRFDTTFVRFERDSADGPITSTITDNLSGHTYQIRSKYLFGCDGARSQIIRQLEIPLVKEPGQGLAFNVLVEADLEKYMKYRTGNLHWIMQPDKPHPSWGWTCINRMVKPWHEWMFIFFAEPGFSDFKIRPSHDEYMKRVREFIGDDDLEVKILDVSKWYINEIVAEKYSDGNIFCMGDAVHRHPPLNGLGSNTCVQDAFNLAWKVAFVEQGLASPKLLESYSSERQPIGEGIIRRANQGLRDHAGVWDALGMMDPDVEVRKKQFGELSEASEAGTKRRQRLRAQIDYTSHEFGGIGVEMNQRYESGAIYLKDEEEARRPPPADPVLQYQISTYPGARLPHAWLNLRTPNQSNVSTIDLAGHGAFCLLTGIGGEKWKTAAAQVGKRLEISVNAYSIGWKQDWEDVYCDWSRRREVEEEGCVLARPDRTVCWRSVNMREDCEGTLEKVLRSVLGKE